MRIAFPFSGSFVVFGGPEIVAPHQKNRDGLKMVGFAVTRDVFFGVPRPCEPFTAVEFGLLETSFDQ